MGRPFHARFAYPPRSHHAAVAWLCRGTAHVLSREETAQDGSSIYVSEAMIQRQFSAGILRCSLTKVGTDGAWLLSGLQVHTACPPCRFASVLLWVPWPLHTVHQKLPWAHRFESGTRMHVIDAGILTRSEPLYSAELISSLRNLTHRIEASAVAG